jgi:hypothetical protein
MLEAEARRRALGSSDALLVFLLKSERPEKYREKTTVDVRIEATKIALRLGLDVEQVIMEAERLLAASQ